MRVRYHDNVARIEVAADKMMELLEKRTEVQHKLVSLGFDYVSIDLRGYRTGSMNEVLPAASSKQQIAANA